MGKQRIRSLLAIFAFVVTLGTTAFAEEEIIGNDDDQNSIIMEDISAYVPRLGGFLPSTDETYLRMPEKMLSGDLSQGEINNLKTAIYNGLRKGEPEIDLSTYGITLDEFGEIYVQVLNEHQELVHVIGGSYTPQNGNVNVLKPKYSTKYTVAHVDALEQKCQEIIAGMKPTFSQEQKVLYLHDYIVGHCQYDLTYSRYNAYDCLVDGSAVCQGYSEAFCLLGQYANLDIVLVTSDDINHAWNMVKLDGVWYFIDATWDDPTGGLYETYCEHTNLLRSHDGMIKTNHDKVKDKDGNVIGTTSDWVTAEYGNVFGYATTSTKYDTYFWSNVIHVIPFLEDTYAYSKSNVNNKVFLKYFNGAERSVELSQPAVWYVWNGGGYYWTTYHISVTSYDGNFYFSTPTRIYKMTKGGEITSEYDLTDTEKARGYLYGIRANETGLDYWLGTNSMGVEFEKGSHAIAKQQAELFKLAGANMNLGNALSMNFFINVSDIENGKEYYVLLTKKYVNGAADSVRKVTQAKWKTYGTNYYYVTFDGISACEMNDTVYAQVFYSDGTPASQVWEDSIVAYAKRAIGSQDQYGQDLFVDMLNYGSAAQQAFDYDTTHLANGWLEEAGYATFGAGNVTCTDHRVKGSNCYGSNLNLGSNLCLNIFFTNVTTDMYAIVTYTTHEDKNFSVRINGNKFIDIGDGIYGVQINTLAVAEAKSLVTCTVYNADGTVHGTAQDSIESYVARVGMTAGSIYETVMKFAKSAHLYFHH